VFLYRYVSFACLSLTNLTFRWRCIVINSYKKQVEAVISQFFFLENTLHVSTSSSVHHQEFFTVHTAMVSVIQVCWQLTSRIRTESVPLLCVQWKIPDDRQRNCPKHVEFYSKNELEKLVPLVGFLIRAYQMVVYFSFWRVWIVSTVFILCSLLQHFNSISMQKFLCKLGLQEQFFIVLVTVASCGIRSSNLCIASPMHCT